MKEWKKQKVEELSKLIENHPVIGIINMYKMPAPQPQIMKKELKGKARIIMSKKSFMIREFPTRTFNFFGSHQIYSGSGYFRLYPYRFVKKMFRSSDYEMAYFHPRDFDNHIHKYLNNHPLLGLRYRIGTNRSRVNLDKFINEFDFITLQKAVQQFDWKNAKVYNLLNGENDVNYRLGGILDLNTSVPLLGKVTLPFDRSGSVKIAR